MDYIYNTAYEVNVHSNNPAYGVNVHSNNPAYGVSSQDKDSRLTTSSNQYELVDLPVTVQTNNDKGVTGAAQVELKNTNSHKASLVIGIALSTAVLALVVAVVSVGLSTALNSNSEIQSQYMNNIQDTIREHSDLLIQLNSKGSITNPATSCSEIPTDRPSGEYWILRNYSPVQVYCDMNRTCCNTTGGWMRVANLDMTDSNQHCPDGFLQHNESMAPLRTCGRPGPPGCVSTTFPVHGIEYSRVCGRVIGYQFASPGAFEAYDANPALTLNDNYVDGVSITHGQSPWKHIWTFAAAVYEVDPNDFVICPCTRSDTPYTRTVPPFIGQDYFCDTGSRNVWQYILYSDDPLWNGQGCGGTSTCCSFNNPPWFCKQLPQPTTDNIELRLCVNQATDDEDIFLELVDIFVQ